MKYILILILFYIGLPLKLFSIDFTEGNECFDINEAEKNREYVCYEIGGCANKYTIYIAEGDTLCDVYISDNKGRCVSTTCKKDPVLQWAFEEMDAELRKAEYAINDEYQAIYYKLSLLKENHEVFVESSYKPIINNKKLRKKIGMLKSFMVKLWAKKFLNLQS